MSSFVKIYTPNEVMTYILKRVDCKVVWQNKENCLFVEIESTDDVDHIDEDAIQNRFPEILLTLEDYPIEFSSLADLIGKKLVIKNSSEEITNEDGDTEEIIYTNLAVDDFDCEAIENILEFYKSEKGTPMLSWKGKCKDFINQSKEYFKFDLKVPVDYEL